MPLKRNRWRRPIKLDDRTKATMPELPTIASSWQSYREALVPAAASQEQVDATRLAFYAGFQTCFEINRGIGEPDCCEEAAFAILSSLDKELREFVATLKARSG
jgi:hypothetical protein